MLNDRSLQRLTGVHPDIALTIEAAALDSPLEFQVSQGLRSVSEQRRLVAEGKSKTMNSRHLTGHAVDIFVVIDGKANWDFKNYRKVADHVKKVAKRLGKSIQWGGDWKSFKDGPHFQLPRRSHPTEAGIPYMPRSSDLRKGARGDLVKALQEKLGIAADGIFGEGTHRAVLDWQDDNGLAPDGIVGPATRKAMKI